MAQHIHCIVSDCHYYGQGNICKANEILVATDEFGANEPDNIDATMASQYTAQQAGTCMATCCKSYVPKGSKETTIDGVKKMS